MMPSRWPTVAVMGAGAVGSYFGGRLARAGAPVTLIGRAAHVAAIARDGLQFESDGRTEVIAVTASTEPAAVAGARYVLFCVKSADTDQAAAAIASHLSGDAVVLSLQNGVGNVERLRARLTCPVVTGLVYVAAQMPAPGRVLHTGGGRLVVGGADKAVIDPIVSLFAAADIAVSVSADVDGELWIKLLMNCAYNAVSALTAAPYGEMVAMPEVRAVMRAAAEEVLAIAAAKRIDVDRKILDTMFDLATIMPRTISSTAQDIVKGRPTEIDHLNGYVAREGERLGIAVPVNRTLNALIKLRERKPPG